jgi:hypothetical protein
MKKKYIVSDILINEKDNKGNYFFHSQVCAHRSGFKLHDLNLANQSWFSKENLELNSLDVEARYHKYVSILAKQLNGIHHTNFSNEFWRRFFSLGLHRHISLLHMFFSHTEKSFDPALYSCEALSKQDYLYPFDFEEQRELLSGSWIGQEQLFSIYLNYFYKGQYSEFSYADKAVKKDANSINKFFAILNKLKKIFIFSELFI